MIEPQPMNPEDVIGIRSVALATAVSLAAVGNTGATELIAQVDGITGTVFWSLDDRPRADGRRVSPECSNHVVWLETDADAIRAASSMRRPLSGWEGTATRTVPTIGCSSSLASCTTGLAGYPDEEVTDEEFVCQASFGFPDAIFAAYMTGEATGTTATLLLFDNGEDCLTAAAATREVFLRCEYDGPHDTSLRLPRRGESTEAWRDRVADLPVGEWVEYGRSFGVVMAAMGASDAVLPRDWPGPGAERQAMVTRDFSACTSISNGRWPVYQGCPAEAEDAGLIGTMDLPVGDVREAGSVCWHRSGQATR